MIRFHSEKEFITTKIYKMSQMSFFYTQPIKLVIW